MLGASMAILPKQPEERPQIKKKTVQEFLGPLKYRESSRSLMSTSQLYSDLRGFLLEADSLWNECENVDFVSSGSLGAVP